MAGRHEWRVVTTCSPEGDPAPETPPMSYPHLTAEQLLRSLAGAKPTDAGLRERLDAVFKEQPTPDGVAESSEPEGGD